ncbi:phytoene/squalene synthase family protein [Haliangium ochraceum]|uniref:Phytoene synthase n=1 Tax=Haliangium ochraceum (strain DSM 14365 / JCM 11303 / SMP-2) TaxID=502025 RepID=D0LV65_HALO1|nr:squalene/phytoene synthase family protein [Haliangium ochraceum]ACY15906.1 Phytoene synthase [Haliangium ochraceum DSM 14365]
MKLWQKLAGRSQSNLYFAFAFLDRPQRSAIRDVYRFARAADDAADDPGAPADTLRRVRAWRRELDAVYAGHPRHPYGRRLARAVRRYRLPRSYFDTLLSGLERDCARPRMASWREVESYCETVAAPLAYLSLHILGASGAAAERYARDVGVAIQLANILRDIAEDAERGRVYLPGDELRAAGVAADEILARHMSPALGRVCQHQAERARTLIATARRGLDPATRRKLLVPEIWADVYLALLDELEASGFDVFRHRPYLQRRRKLALALRRWAATRA